MIDVENTPIPANPQECRDLSIRILEEIINHEQALEGVSWDMEEWMRKDPKCGTVCCAGGHLDEFLHRKGIPRNGFNNSEYPEPWLGIDEETAGRLFIGPYGVPLSSVTPQMVLDRAQAMFSKSECPEKYPWEEKNE